MPHQHLSFQCLHGFQSNTDNDDDGGTADGQAGGHQVTCNDGQQSNNSQINSAKHNDLIDDLLDEVSSGLAGTEAGDETAVLLQLVLLHHSVRSC